MPKLRPVVKWHGAKYYQIDFILSNFPPNYNKLIYLELFGGAANILGNKLPSPLEIYNDIYAPIANVFAILASSASDLLIKRINEITYSQESFEKAKKVEFHWGTIDSAIAEIVLCRMSRGGMKKTFSQSTRLRGGIPEGENSWRTFKLLLPKIAKRFSGVEVKCMDALKLKKEFIDNANTLHYDDPPYVTSTRTAKQVYDCEMTDKEHAELAEINNACKGKIIISAYDSPLYRKLYKSWNWVSKEMPNHSGQGKKKQRRVEWLIKNY